MKSARFLGKMLLTILACGIAWALEWGCMLAMNLPNTALVLVGALGLVVMLFLWCMAIGAIWGVRRKIALLYLKIKEELKDA